MPAAFQKLERGHHGQQSKPCIATNDGPVFREYTNTAKTKPEELITIGVSSRINPRFCSTLQPRAIRTKAMTQMGKVRK
eukprot:UN07377